MKTTLLLFLFFVSTSKGFSQNQSPINKNSCIEVINRLSEGWKLDSTGNNGFRRDNTKYVRSCKTENLTK